MGHIMCMKVAIHIYSFIRPNFLVNFKLFLLSDGAGAAMSGWTEIATMIIIRPVWRWATCLSWQPIGAACTLAGLAAARIFATAGAIGRLVTQPGQLDHCASFEGFVGDLTGRFESSSRLGIVREHHGRDEPLGDEDRQEAGEEHNVRDRSGLGVAIYRGLPVKDCIRQHVKHAETKEHSASEAVCVRQDGLMKLGKPILKTKRNNSEPNNDRDQQRNGDDLHCKRASISDIWA
eukprot:TRINITY_DN26757_c0_g1_i1.p2 TRINITY_DN26757_c0_g1~~TRINITY_DN26757_c0_g1_i1.p2  ORF type:complete len:234 (-),score=1.50 TRINITY_DN26757_c0_g1_i1:196-897(-)